MNAFTLSSSYDKTYNDQLINKINIRMKEKFNSKMGMKLQQFEQLKNQLRVFKQKMFNQNKFNYLDIQNKNNMQHKNSQTQKCVINNSKTINQGVLIKNTKEDDVVKRRKVKRLIFQEKKKTDFSLDKNQMLNSSRKKQKFRKRFSMSPLQLKIFRKAKRTNQSLSTINNTLPLKALSRRTKVKSELKGSSPVMSRQRSDLSAQNMDYKCKIKAEQLIDLVKQQQIKQYNKRCLDRLSNDKNKAIYEQALQKIYEIARYKMQNKQPYEVPKQLGINKIFIPKRLQKTQSIKRNQYILPNYDRKERQWQKCIQRKSYNQIQRGYNGRQRVRQRKAEQNPRNQTQWLSYREYVDDTKNEQKINGWQYDIQSSKQLLI